MAATIFAKGNRGRTGFRLSSEPAAGGPPLPEEYLRRGEIGLPEVGEPEVVRHYLALSLKNHHVDKDFYPLGSCTMKYNPKFLEEVAAIAGFARLHPDQDEEDVQGALEVIYTLERRLAEITGMDAFCLHPAAGAHGELLGMIIARRYFQGKGEPRSKVLVPDTAHGTNPASVHIAGFQARTITSGSDGEVDLEELKQALDDEVAVLMLTVPNTLGLFERKIGQILEMVHAQGALCYMDGANLNAILGRARPGDMGFDIIHLNLHKTFATPHGGGGPGAGPVGVKAELAHLLPPPRVVAENGRYRWEGGGEEGSVHSYYGNFAVCLKALAYIEALGGEGMRRVSAAANLNANYLAKQLGGVFPIPYGIRCMHEFVAAGEPFKEFGVRTLDIAKRLLDHGFHAPTIYFPLVVKEALMIEPTETESKETLDRFAAAMMSIADEARKDPELLLGAPHNTPVGRVDEVRANRKPEIVEPLAGKRGPSSQEPR